MSSSTLDTLQVILPLLTLFFEHPSTHRQGLHHTFNIGTVNMSPITQLSSTECCPSSNCLYMNPGIPNCSEFKWSNLPTNVTAEILPSRGQLDPGTSNWITYYDPEGYDKINTGQKLGSQYLFLSLIIMFVVAVIFAAIVTVCGPSKNQVDECDVEEHRERLHTGSRKRTRCSTNSNGGLRNKWLNLMKGHSAGSRSSSSTLSTRRARGENMGMGLEYSNPSTSFPEIPLTRVLNSSHQSQMPVGLYIGMTTNQMLDQDCHTYPSDYNPWIEDSDIPHNRRSNESAVLGYAEVPLPSYTPAYREGRRGSIDTLATVVPRASWEGRPRTPPPTYEMSGRDRLHVDMETDVVDGREALAGSAIW